MYCSYKVGYSVGESEQTKLDIAIALRAQVEEERIRTRDSIVTQQFVSDLFSVKDELGACRRDVQRLVANYALLEPYIKSGRLAVADKWIGLDSSIGATPYHII